VTVHIYYIIYTLQVLSDLSDYAWVYIKINLNCLLKTILEHVLLAKDAFCNLKQTGVNCKKLPSGNRLSGKMTIRETTVYLDFV